MMAIASVPVPTPMAWAAPHAPAKAVLEGVHLRPEHVPAALDHAPDGGVDGLAVLAGDEAHERDAGCGHGAAGPLSSGSR